MARIRPQRLAHITGIGVDRMGAIADSGTRDLLRLENLDTDVPPDPEAVERTRRAARLDDDNSYLPFVGQAHLRNAAAAHVSRLSGVAYSGERNVVIAAGGLCGILNVLLATIETAADEIRCLGVTAANPDWVALNHLNIAANRLYDDLWKFVGQVVASQTIGGDRQPVPQVASTMAMGRRSMPAGSPPVSSAMAS